MTTLQFKDALTENAFSYSNGFYYSDLRSLGLYFVKKSDNYPYILKGAEYDDFEMQFSSYSNQLRGRMLNTKKIKEIMDSSRLPLLFKIKMRPYLIGKGFLSTYDPITGEVKLLFIACVDDRKGTTSIEQVKFFVCKDIYTDEHKALQPTIKDLIDSHPGDVVMCNKILDYIGEKISIPRGGTIAERKSYADAVVRAALLSGLTTNNKDSLSTQIPW